VNFADGALARAPSQLAGPDPIAAALLGGTLRPHSVAARQRSQHHEAALQAHHALVAAAGKAAGPGAGGSRPGQPHAHAAAAHQPGALHHNTAGAAAGAAMHHDAEAAAAAAQLGCQPAEELLAADGALLGGPLQANSAQHSISSGQHHSHRHGLIPHAYTSTDPHALLPVLVAPTPQSILPPHIGGGMSAQPVLLVPAAGGGVPGPDGRGQLVPVPVSAVGPDSGVATATTEARHMVDRGASSQLLSETGVCTALTALWRCGGDDTGAADATDEAREQARDGGVLLAFALQPTMLADAASDNAGAAGAAAEGDGTSHGASGGASAVPEVPSSSSLPRLQPCVAHMAHLPSYPQVEGAADAAEAAGGAHRDSDASDDDVGADAGAGSGLTLRKLLPPCCHSALLITPVLPVVRMCVEQAAPSARSAAAGPAAAPAAQGAHVRCVVAAAGLPTALVSSADGSAGAVAGGGDSAGPTHTVSVVSSNGTTFAAPVGALVPYRLRYSVPAQAAAAGTRDSLVLVLAAEGSAASATSAQVTSRECSPPSSPLSDRPGSLRVGSHEHFEDVCHRRPPRLLCATRVSLPPRIA